MHDLHDLPDLADRREPTATTSRTTTTDVTSLVRRALLASASELVDGLATLEPADRRRQRALDGWFAGFADQLRRHHELLDSIVVPALAGRGALDQRSLDTLAADHAWIDQLLSDLGDALGVLSFGLGAGAWWIGKASDLAVALQHVLAGQLSREERLLRPLVDRWLDDRERDVLQHEAMRAVATGTAQCSLAWLSIHLDDAERAAIAGYVPVTGRLSWRSRRAAVTRR